MMDDPLRHREGICKDEHGGRRKIKISISLTPQPKREQSDQFSKPLKASTDHRKVSGTSAEAHDKGSS
jgi:hypothetical protein